MHSIKVTIQIDTLLIHLNLVTYYLLALLEVIVNDFEKLSENESESQISSFLPESGHVSGKIYLLLSQLQF